jgi:predicted O-methyltransferase YrrM
MPPEDPRECAGSSTLRCGPLAGVLERLFALAAQEDPRAKGRIRVREAELGARLAQPERYALYGGAPQAVSREVGELLYALALSTRAGTIVEFGCSLGVSTLHLAAALRDAGSQGTLITTEMNAGKIELARQNLADAGLDDLVELWPGDARLTLADLRRRVDLLFLDGRNDLYLQVLRIVDHALPRRRWSWPTSARMTRT